MLQESLFRNGNYAERLTSLFPDQQIDPAGWERQHGIEQGNGQRRNGHFVLRLFDAEVDELKIYAFHDQAAKEEKKEIVKQIFSFLPVVVIAQTEKAVGDQHQSGNREKHIHKQRVVVRIGRVGLLIEQSEQHQSNAEQDQDSHKDHCGKRDLFQFFFHV